MNEYQHTQCLCVNELYNDASFTGSNARVSNIIFIKFNLLEREREES